MSGAGKGLDTTVSGLGRNVGNTVGGPVGKTLGDTTGKQRESSSLHAVEMLNTAGNLGKTVSGTTSGLGNTVGDTAGAIGRGDISGVASGATGGVGQTLDGAGRGVGGTVEGLGKNVSLLLLLHASYELPAIADKSQGWWIYSWSSRRNCRR